MKREYNKFNIRKHYGWLIWRVCDSCRHEFRREHGYKFDRLMTHTLYLCGGCASTEIAAKEYASKSPPPVGKRPGPPPPPPPRMK